MRWVALLLLVLAVAGCTGPSPLNPYPSANVPEVRALIEARPYDSEGDEATDGFALTLRSAQPTTPLVGSEVLIERNGDANVTVWRCPERDPERCQSNRGILAWDAGETVYIRAAQAGPNRLNVIVKERFVYNTTLRADEVRDTEIWAVLTVTPYDSDGNQTVDGLQIGLVDSDKAPFRADEVRVLLNQVEVPVFTDAKRTREFTSGSWIRNGKLFVDGFIGENRVEVFVRATKYDMGTYLVRE